MTDSPVIDVTDLTKTYRDGFLGRQKVEALRGVSLQVEPGEIFGLLGPNGAGKTTLIKVLLGIVRRTDGQARMLGRPAGDRAARKRVGFLPEHHRIPHHLTGNTAMEYYGGLSGMSGAEIRARRPELLRTVGLEKWGKTPVKKYSKGMQQRLGLAQAMLHDPDLLILDEPTDGVDPVGRAEIRRILQRLKSEGKTIFLNSHLLQELELVCDRVAILNAGRVRKVGGVQELTEGLPDAAGGEQIVMTFRLEGEEAAIRGAFEDREIAKWETVGEQRFEVTLPVPDQAAVDASIDALRAAQISVYSIARRRVTLEEAFLEIVQEPSGE